ncbi:ferrous iron transport protein B [Fontivita pretiosa]|uniref:ferrous iron transport protein B n=1 Tax=Fontivita pretiosa TaxID=2989684 RepID=UPI003D1658D4
MSSCCDQLDTPVRASSKASLTIALAGNPNSGKTTIFNALTGLRQKVGNYPGVTVEKKVGRCRLPDGRWAQIIDLPGTYSLISRSPDETIAMEVLRGLVPGMAAPDVVIVVVDASNLQRNLYLVSQLIELGRPMVVALNMMDVAERRGLHVSPEALARELGVPVVPVVGHKRQGISELKAQILNARVAPLPDFPLPEAMKEELLTVGQGLAIIDSATPSAGTAGDGRDPDPLPEHRQRETAPSRAWICGDDSLRHLDRYQALAERLLIGDRAADVAPLASRQPVASLLQSAMSRLNRLGIDPMQADVEAHYRWIESVAARSTATLDELAAMGSPAPRVLEYEAKKPHLTDQVDAIFMHRIWGFVVFGAIMAALFISIFWLADPIMGLVEDGVAWLGGLIAPLLPAGPLRDLWTDGIVAGVGAVVVFVPQIAILFTFLAILEDSGYLARAAFLMDRVLAKVGLHGKSFIPLLSSFACAIPGIMATRTIENRKDRLATIFVAPFMSCSARLPVYALLIGTFFGAYSSLVQGGIMFGCYALGILAAAGTAFLFKRTLLKGPTPAFILEMPTYKVPQLSQVVRAVVTNTGAFLKKAGTIIFCLSVIMWAMMYYPRLPAAEVEQVRTENDAIAYRTAVLSSLLEAKQRALLTATVPTDDWIRADIKSRTERILDDIIAGEQLRYSIAGRFGRVLEPLIKPLGYDWKMGVGLIGAFAAREVFVSTMGIVYSVGDDDQNTEPLSAQMQSDRYPDGRPVWTPLVAVSLLVWFVLAMQCMSTLAIVRRETGGWRWPIAMLLYMNALAYVVSLAVYQVGRIWL